jgi:hypothetical protein
MLKFIRTLLVGTLILCACSPVFPSPAAIPQNSSPTGEVTTTEAVSQTEPPTQSPPSTNISITETSPESPAIPKPLQTLQAPHIDQAPDGITTPVPSNPQECGYQWAYKDLPETSSNFQQSIQALQPGAQASAFGFGENCVHADGTSNFIPMETDFNVTLQVSDLSDKSALGDWIVNVMQIIENIPADQIIGPRPGRLSILFASNGQQQAVNFYIDQYRSLAAGLSSAEIYQALQTPQ